VSVAFKLNIAGGGHAQLFIPVLSQVMSQRKKRHKKRAMKTALFQYEPNNQPI